MRWWFKKRIRSEVKGTVVSVRVGARTRVTVRTVGGACHCYFTSEAKTKPGRKVRKGTALGYR